MSQSSWNKVADRIWQRVYETHPNQLRHWVQCLEPHDPYVVRAIHDVMKEWSKKEISKTLSCDEYQKDGKKNFILRLIRDDEYGRDGRDQHVRKVQLALAFLQAMTDIPECNNFIQATLKAVQIQGHKSRCNSIVHELARCGFYSQYQNQCSAECVRLLNGMNETPLHLAAQVGNKDDVRSLLENGADIDAKDKDGCTPLHSAGMAIHPDHEIAEMLINEAKQRDDYHLLLNYATTDDQDNNTVLHLAAGNANITHKFISQFKDADPERQNAFCDTPFHVAAKSSNPKAIIYMLKTFSPLRGGWDVDDVELNRPKATEVFYDDDDLDRNEPLETLLTTCAKRGNAEAVALLIQHGADISKGVLHDIVDESVKSPQKTDKLLEVYRTIVDNAVTWKCLELNRKTWTKGSFIYKKCLKAAVFSLITKPVTEGEDDVLERAIKRGASKMFQEIVNTEGVFRRSVDESCAWFNITNFSLAIRGTRETDGSMNQHVSKTPYLHSLLMNHDRWADTKILNIQPIADLTKPCIRMTQAYRFTIGLIQLIFMIVFSFFYIPDTCLYPDIFNSSSSNFSNAWMTKNNCLWNLEKAEAKISWFPGLFLAWTYILCTISLVSFGIDSLGLWNTTVTITGNSCTRFINHVMTLFILIWQVFPRITFIITVQIFYDDISNEAYDLQTISMVFLCGWIYTLWLLSNTRKEFSIFTWLLKEAILIDILQSFLPVFAFTVIAFSFSLYVLRVELLPTEQHELSDTVYEVLAASFGMGEELFENVKAPSKSVFAVVFMTYMFFTAIILINVLIAMISNRYEVAKRKAENLWRHQTLLGWMVLEICGVARCLLNKKSMVGKLLLYKDIKTEMFKDMECVFIKVVLKGNEPEL